MFSFFFSFFFLFFFVGTRKKGEGKAYSFILSIRRRNGYCSGEIRINPQGDPIKRRREERGREGERGEREGERGERGREREREEREGERGRERRERKLE